MALILDPKEIYLLEDSRQSNQVKVFWRFGLSGYTSDIAAAHRFTGFELMRLTSIRTTDRPVKLDDCVKSAVKCVPA